MDEEQRIREFNKKQQVFPDEQIVRYEDLEDDEKEDMMWEEEKHRRINNREEGTVNMSNTRITNSRLNAHITLPQSQPVEKEAEINLRIGRYNKIAAEYHQNETKDGAPRSNLERSEALGLNSISKRIKAKELIMLQSDKSGKLVPTKR